jgi:methylenetetrahydrofolate reductase (NADPH)
MPRGANPIAKRPSAAPRHLNISFEFFPPKTEKMHTTLWQAIKKLEPLSPDFVSVTYGAGGSTRKRTHKTVSRIAQETSLSAAAHLTCVDASSAEIDAIAKAYWDAGIRHIVALRGDPQDGIGQAYRPQRNGYGYASDLVAGLKKVSPFEISVGAYPERHPESPDWNAEIDNLKRKIDAGATRAITQFFFETDTFLKFRDRAVAAGINIPLVPGLMLQPNFDGLKRMSKMCKIHIPDWYHKLFVGLEDDPQSRLLLTATTTADLAADLRANGVRDFHFYTLNKADLAFSVCKILGVQTSQEIQV